MYYSVCAFANWSSLSAFHHHACSRFVNITPLSFQLSTVQLFNCQPAVLIGRRPAVLVGRRPAVNFSVGRYLAANGIFEDNSIGILNYPPSTHKFTFCTLQSSIVCTFYYCKPFLTTYSLLATNRKTRYELLQDASNLLTKY
jgi:hypothetical protein